MSNPADDLIIPLTHLRVRDLRALIANLPDSASVPVVLTVSGLSALAFDTAVMTEDDLNVELDLVHIKDGRIIVDVAIVTQDEEDNESEESPCDEDSGS